MTVAAGDNDVIHMRGSFNTNRNHAFRLGAITQFDQIAEVKRSDRVLKKNA
jgi:hypothetical protein